MVKKKSGKKIQKKAKRKAPRKSLPKRAVKKRPVAAVAQRDRRDERRINPRLPIAARVYWRTDSETEGGEQIERYYFTRDLSSSGLFLLTDHPPPLHCEIEIQLSIQFMKEALRLRGEVVRHESQEGRAIGFAVRFSENPNRLKLLMGELTRALKTRGLT